MVSKPQTCIPPRCLSCGNAEKQIQLVEIPVFSGVGFVSLDLSHGAVSKWLGQLSALSGFKLPLDLRRTEVVSVGVCFVMLGVCSFLVKRR